MEDKSKILQFRQFLTTHAHKLSTHPKFVYQFAVNQNRHQLVSNQAREFITANRV
jgi:hypothetical protein